MIKKREKVERYEYSAFNIQGIKDLNELGNLGWIFLMDKNEVGQHWFYRKQPKKLKCI